ncbi:MAG: hypothetical protein ACNA78_09215 [Balneolaceae bacterium]
MPLNPPSFTKNLFAFCCFVLLCGGGAFSALAQTQPTSHPIDTAASATALPDSVTKPADTRYTASGVRKLWFGSQYRELWDEPVTFKVIDLETYEGGMDIYRFGGGQQSTTAFARSANGGHYVLRSIPKNPVVFAEDQTDPIQIMFNRSVIRDILQDLISSSHPYGPLSVTPIVRAAGLYYADYSLVYIPEQPGTEEFPETGVNVPYMKEPFVDVDYLQRFDDRIFEVVSTTDLIDRMLQGEPIRMDAETYLRSRMISILLGDWDRHEGQYFYALIRDENDNVIARPYKLDFDGAYFLMNGVLPRVGTRARALRKFQHFDEEIISLEGLTEQSRYMDEFFLNELPKERWVAVAEDLKQRLTDDTFEQAIALLPLEARRLTADHIRTSLKQRRDDLPRYAEEFYDIISREIDVIGNEHNNRFVVSDHEHDSVLVEMYEGDEKTYSRVVYSDETRSLRLFGIGGQNEFVFNSDRELPVTTHIVEGKEPNKQVAFNGRVHRKNLNMHPKDHPDFDLLEFKFNTRDFTSSTMQNYGFNFQEANDDLFEVMPSFRANTEDGIFVGLTATLSTYRFRRYPFSTQQKLTIRSATLSSAYTVRYRAIFTDLIGSFDLLVNLGARSPDIGQNFFGIGNETEEFGDSSFHDLRKNLYTAEVGINRRIGKLHRLRVMGALDIVNPQTDKDKFFLRPEANLLPDDLESQTLLGIKTNYQLLITDRRPFTRREFQIQTDADYAHNFLDNSDVVTLGINVSGAHPVLMESIVLASRVGASTNIGDFRFHQARTLGGIGSFLRSSDELFTDGNFRGVDRDRFSGRSVFYHNTDLRIKLFDANLYVLPGDFGISGSFDHGRVWAPNESSSVWHYSYGGGLWYNFYKSALLSISYAESDVDSKLSFLIGFMF